MTKLSFTNKLLIAGAGATFVFAASPSQAVVINPTNFTGWQSVGNVSLSDQGASLSSTVGVSDTDIETFLGLDAGALDSINFEDATNGSAIKNTFTVESGDVLTFDWRFQTSDYLPYNDFSFYSIGSSVSKLADVQQVGDYGNTTSQTSYTFTTAGTYTVGFGVVNSRDTAVNSNLNVGVVPDGVVPEPITILGSLTAGAFGVVLRRKQKQQQQATSKV
ncbi:PEP-CTERM sorting domain-containing protein [Nostoc sp. UHCC 0702]|nr:PEP-CTERM sorting domain-containing protein [Nostoc sp. UHCC 0702]